MTMHAVSSCSGSLGRRAHSESSLPSAFARSRPKSQACCEATMPRPPPWCRASAVAASTCVGAALRRCRFVATPFSVFDGAVGCRWIGMFAAQRGAGCASAVRLYGALAFAGGFLALRLHFCSFGVLIGVIDRCWRCELVAPEDARGANASCFWVAIGGTVWAPAVDPRLHFCSLGAIARVGLVGCGVSVGTGSDAVMRLCGIGRHWSGA